MSSEPPLIMACRNGDCDAIRAVFGALVDQQTDSQKRTPLHVACGDGHVDCARLLIMAGAAVDLAMVDGATPLYVSC